MANLTEWALRHGVSAEAMFELEVIVGVYSKPTESDESESAVQTKVRLEAPRKGVHLFRNNVGVLKDETGRPVRYGLANDSSKVNKIVKSGDLIGWRKVLITEKHVGRPIAQFVSRECKAAAWTFSGTDREMAQLNWINLILVNGGDACFCTGEGTL